MGCKMMTAIIVSKNRLKGKKYITQPKISEKSVAYITYKMGFFGGDVL
jgi:hypothetical protein